MKILSYEPSYVSFMVSYKLGYHYYYEHYEMIKAFMFVLFVESFFQLYRIIHLFIQ